MTGVIVADDLTGAADACAAFVTRGRSGVVLFDATLASSIDAEIVAFSTDTRTRPAAQAADRVRDAVQQLTLASRPALLFKKIDSTLRGHVGAELTAALLASDARLAIVTPAFPAMGRTLEEDVLRVRGVVRTGSATSSRVTTSLESQGVRGCRWIARPVGADPGASSRASANPNTGVEPDAHRSAEPGAHPDVAHDWRARMIAAVQSGARVLVCDSVTDADLDAIVDAASTLDGPLLWVGSAGLAGALARRMPPAHLADSRPGLTRPTTARSGSVIFWIGSHHPVTMEQRRYLLRHADHIMVTSVDDAARLAQHVDRGHHVVLDIGPRIAGGTLARLAQRAIEIQASDRPVAGFVMTGGDTAARVCRLLDASILHVDGEVSRGIPHGRLLTRSGRVWPVVLKSGGFGTERALHETLAFLTDRGAASVGEVHA